MGVIWNSFITKIFTRKKSVAEEILDNAIVFRIAAPKKADFFTDKSIEKVKKTKISPFSGRKIYKDEIEVVGGGCYVIQKKNFSTSSS